jgi:RNA polymerase sigma-70 factor (ECF subfamily)
MVAPAREERAWVRRAQDGSVSDLEALFRLHWPTVYRAAYLIVQDRLSAQEVAQEAVLAAVRVLQRFGRDRPFGPWLYRTVVTRSIDAARGRVSRRGAVREALLHVPDPLGWSQPVIDPLAEDEALGIAHGLSFLSPEQRAGIILRYLFEYAPREIAEILDLRRSTVNARLRRDRDHLEARLAVDGGLSAHDLQAYLLSIPLPDERIAEDRAWDVVRAAFAAREPVERVRSFPWRSLALFALAVAAAGVALSPAGRELWDRFRDEVGRERVVTEGLPPAETEVGLPAPGELLVLAGGRVSVVSDDGSRRELGEYSGAAWSPDGTYVTVWDEGQLAALDPAGEGGVQWSVEGEGIADAVWSETGFRVAYRRGSSLRAVAANGTEDGRLASGVAGVAPAWRPGQQEVLVYVNTKAEVVAMDADARERLWRVEVGSGVAALAWTGNGKQLAVLGERELRLYAEAAPAGTVRLPDGTAGTAIAARPGDGEDLAYAVFSPAAAKGSVYLYEGRTGESRLLFAGAGRLDELVWSPDGRYLLLGWRAADQWLFVPASRGAEVVTQTGVTERFGDFPQAAGWCCAPEGA